MFLNTRQPPFTSLKARQAVNYAIDRARILQLSSLAPGQAAVTCQILPADFPGHQSYCPYTTGTKDGSWHGPDMAKARQLAEQSGTTNVPVTVWTFNDSGTGRWAPTLSGSSKTSDTGHTSAACPLTGFSPWSATPTARFKWVSGQWGADFPSASDFLPPLLSCRSFYQDPSNTSNYAEFCDPHVDKLASQAQAAQLTDPATARRLWAQVDRIVTDQAP